MGLTDHSRLTYSNSLLDVRLLLGVKAGATLGKSGSADCALLPWDGESRKRGRLVPEGDDSHVVYFETEASH